MTAKTRHHQFNSSFLDSATYNIKDETLVVEFNNGKSYTYEEVSPEAFEAFVNADSPGQWYGMNVKSHYKIKVED